jgi:hypothetical protein
MISKSHKHIEKNKFTEHMISKSHNQKHDVVAFRVTSCTCSNLTPAEKESFSEHIQA